MKSRTSPLTAAGLLLAVLAIAVPAARSQTFTTFDPPGSQGTTPTSINPAGQIVGTYFDSNFVTHGFVRAKDGIITSFDVPGMLNTSTPPLITPLGSVVGSYFDANFTTHIFQRAKDGTITTLEIPDPGAFIYAVVANSAGAIAGGLIDSNGPQFFIRSASGKFTLFAIPPKLLPSFFLPNITAMTPGGTILGGYFDSNLVTHGFLSTIDGDFTTFDAPNAAPGFFAGTIPTSINDSGIVAGFYYDTTQNSDLRVFLRAANGVFSNFATPQLGDFGGAASINSSGAVAGNVQNTVCTSVSCTTTLTSFLRAANGTVKSVNDPAAVQGTLVLGINPAGEMFGVYSDANNMQHGFVAKP
jgi:hypothetical protein